MSETIDAADTTDRVKPWTIKGIPPEERNAAIAAAEREGLTIGEWLTRAIRTQVPADRQADRVPAVVDEPVRPKGDRQADLAKQIVEFIGAFFLVLTIALTGNPIAIGFVLVALVYMGGYISGGHYNPAVTLAALLTRKIELVTALRYMLVQLLGGLVGAVVYNVVVGKYFHPVFGPDVTRGLAIFLETLFTFLLCSVVLHVAATDKTKGNDYYGLAIGLTVMAGAFAAGPISGAAFNPAVAVGPVYFELLFGTPKLHAHVPHLITYVVGPFLGAAIAAGLYRITNVSKT